MRNVASGGRHSTGASIVLLAGVLAGACAETHSEAPHGAVADAVRAALSAGELYLHDPALDVDLSLVRDPWDDHRAGFYVHLRAREPESWLGVIGTAPVVDGGEQEPFSLAPLGPHAWQLSSGWEPSRWVTIDVVDGERIVVVADGVMQTVVLRAAGRSGLASWYAARVQETLQAASRQLPDLTGRGPYAYDGVALTECALLAEDCELDRLVVSCRGGADTVVRVRAHPTPRAHIIPARSPHQGASLCVSGPAGILRLETDPG